jgi:hypothetical protein
MTDAAMPTRGSGTECLAIRRPDTRRPSPDAFPAVPRLSGWRTTVVSLIGTDRSAMTRVAGSSLRQQRTVVFVCKFNSKCAANAGVHSYDMPTTRLDNVLCCCLKKHPENGL